MLVCDYDMRSVVLVCDYDMRSVVLVCDYDMSSVMLVCDYDMSSLICDYIMNELCGFFYSEEESALRILLTNTILCPNNSQYHELG